jgi:very-short-patch-repair endonuclease
VTLDTDAPAAGSAGPGPAVAQPGDPLLETALGASLERRTLVERVRQRWISRLIDLSRRNRLLYFEPLRVRSVELDGERLARALPLLSGQAVPVGRVFGVQQLVGRDEDMELFSQLDELETADLGVARRLREIQKRGDEDFEERGLETVHLAYGMATWKPSDEGRPPEAAVLLVPLAVVGTANRLSLHPRGDLDVNLALTHVLEDQFGCEGLASRLEGLLAESDELEAPARAERVFQDLREAARGVPGFELRPRAVISNFAFQKLAMVEDLERWREHMPGHEIVAAIAGDAGARGELSQQRVEVDARELDSRPPEQEFLVLDADSSQLRAIAATLRRQSGVIIGPPGTGKSQTIANLVAELVASGQRVLFVAEKRAALDVVRGRLEQRRLGGLVLDIHGALSRKEIMRQFASALEALSEVVPPRVEDLHRAFSGQRRRLNEYEERLHRPRAPTGWSAYQLLGYFGTLRSTEATSAVRWRGAELDPLTPTQVAIIEDILRRAAAEPALFLRTSTSPWTNAALHDAEAVADATTLAEALHGSHLPQLMAWTEHCSASVGLRPPVTIADWEPVLAALEAANRLTALYGAGLFDLDLSGLAADMRPARTPLGSLWAPLTSAGFRATRRRLRGMRRSKASAAAMAAEVDAAARLSATWGELAVPDRAPAAYEEAGQLRACWQAVVHALERLGVYVGLPPPSAPTGQLSDLLGRLASDSQTPARLPALRAYERELRGRGVSAFLDELRLNGPPVDRWVPGLRHAWIASSVERLMLEEPELAVFSGREHEKVVEDFKRLDRALLEAAVERVRRAHAERAIETANEFREQWLLLRHQAGLRSRHLPFRELMRRAPEAVTAVKPCWMASPLAVSQILGDTRQHFDVVVFDEASQVLPEDAISAILRGRSLVVAGDPHQLPPTQFFAADRDEGQETREAEETEGFESILDVMATFLPRWQLDWHYRSRDERLIAFSNRYVYGDRLVTFPSSSWQTPAVSHVLVDQGRLGGVEEASPTAEVRRVVELVREHARTRAEMSLGVITMGIKHADRIEAELARAVRDDPQLEDFLAAPSEERFFVKNLERVQGDERDEIILSIGYGKDGSGRLPYRFGPLLVEGGHRRLNVAVTRARQRITVVSSFSHLDMDPARSSKLGVELLRRYLEYAASGGRGFGDGEAPATRDHLETQLEQALLGAGLEATARFGASRYRIDLAVRHPEEAGRYLLAIESDGPGYHSAPTARDRDRLREEHLEVRGWSFLRVWSPDWFRSHDQEVARVVESYRRAVAGEGSAGTPAAAAAPGGSGAVTVTSGQRRSAPPALPRGLPIDDYDDAGLRRLLRWVKSDGRLRTDDDLLEAMMEELGLERHGRRIDARLRAVIEDAD